jgi:thiol:disulfide interchange protein DsbD
MSARGQLDVGIASGQGKSGEQLVPVRVLSDADVIHPGQQFHLAVLFTIEPGWHIYWEDPGAAGLPTEVQVEGPETFVVESPRFPRPMAFDEPEGQTYGYEKETVLFVPVRAPADVPEGEVRFQVSATWLVCKTICLMGAAEQTLTVRTTAVPAADSAPRPAATTREAEIMTRHAGRLARPLDRLDGATIEFDGARLVLSGPAGGHAKASLFPVEKPGVTYGSKHSSVDADRFRIAVDVEVDPENALGEPMAIRGLVALGTTLDDPCYEFTIPLDASGHARAGGGQSGGSGTP